MRALNRQFRGKDKVTDVLSFPAETRGFLGDVVIAGGVVEAPGARGRALACRRSCGCSRYTVCYISWGTITRPMMARWRAPKRV